MNLYWDDFDRRVKETADCIIENIKVPIRRVSTFITNQCNFRCKYCNVKFEDISMEEETFDGIVNKYGRDAIIHITGGEPSIVKWLYPYINTHKEYKFNLNTNCFIKPPVENINRLKVSLDTNIEEYFNYLSGVNSFSRVVENIKEACNNTIVSITCVLTKNNYKNSPYFMKWCRENFKNLYAVFFSMYKGTNPLFVFTEKDINDFFQYTLEELKNEMDKESLELLIQTIDEKRRMIDGNRFPENSLDNPCYLSMSEITISPSGEIFNCSHLYRDKIFHKDFTKHEKCKYGCNRRLVKFNEDVKNLLK